MPVRGVIFIVFIAIILAIAGREYLCDWIEYRPEDDDIDNNHFSKED